MIKRIKKFNPGCIPKNYSASKDATIHFGTLQPMTLRVLQIHMNASTQLMYINII